MYEFYSIQAIMNPHYFTFEELSRDDRKLNVGKFCKILSDLGIKLPKLKITEVFKKCVIGKHLMNLPEFYEAMERIFIEFRWEKVRKCEV